MSKNIFIILFLISLFESLAIPAEEDKTQRFINIYSEDESTYCATWASSQYLTESNNEPPITLSENSLRQIVHVSVGGELLRIKFSNRCGRGNLEIKEVRIADSKGQGTGEIDEDTTKEITFGGEKGIIIPAGEEIYCDTFTYPLLALSEVAVSIYFGEVPQDLTGHPGSRTFSFIEEGNKIQKVKFTSKNKVAHWYVLAGIEVSSKPAKKVVICYGDSITDGRGSTDDKQNRWTDRLAFKLQNNKNTSNIAVVNEGIGATLVTSSGVERFERDVTEIKGATYVIMLYGINDIIFGEATAEILIDTYKNLIKKAHKANLFIYAGTILPFGKSQYYEKSKDKIRREVNEWIRSTSSKEGGFDAFFDFDDKMKDPINSSMLDLYYECGDGLHPSPEGYEWMVSAIEDLSLFTNVPDFDIEELFTPLSINNIPGVKYKLNSKIGKDNEIIIKIKGSCKNSKGFRVWTTDDKELRTSNYFKTGPIEGNFEINANLLTNNLSSYLLIKGPLSTINIDTLTINSIEVTTNRNTKLYNPSDAENINS